MKIRHVLVLSLLLSIRLLAQVDAPKTAPKADDRLKADILLIVAHPDDETGASAYLAQALDQGKRVAAVYMTHGEAGHNNMGRERGVSLGVARETELRHAMAELGVRNVWFLDGRDTPTQDVLQSLANWHHGANLEEVVRIVRITRPSVILTWLPGFFIGENHGDHQASGVIATEAFDSAGDPAVFPAQLAQPRHVNETLLEGLEPWQPQKIYYFSDARDGDQFKGKGPEYVTTGISPSRHLPYWRIAMDSFRYHLTQYRSYIEKYQALDEAALTKLASAEQDGWATPVQFIFGKSNVPGSPTGDIFEGVRPDSISFTPPPAPTLEQHSGLSLELGGPWRFYDNFRRAHGLSSLPQAATPEISVAVSTDLQIPLLIRNDTDQPAEVTLSLTLPEGWKGKDVPSRLTVAAKSVHPVQIVVTASASKSDKNELVFSASAAGQTVGTIKLRVRLGSGGLPQ